MIAATSRINASSGLEAWLFLAQHCDDFGKDRDRDFRSIRGANGKPDGRMDFRKIRLAKSRRAQAFEALRMGCFRAERADIKAIRTSGPRPAPGPPSADHEKARQPP